VCGAFIVTDPLTVEPISGFDFAFGRRMEHGQAHDEHKHIRVEIDVSEQSTILYEGDANVVEHSTTGTSSDTILCDRGLCLRCSNSRRYLWAMNNVFSKSACWLQKVHSWLIPNAERSLWRRRALIGSVSILPFTQSLWKINLEQIFTELLSESEQEYWECQMILQQSLPHEMSISKNISGLWT
jgi:hypothetical protein